MDLKYSPEDEAFRVEVRQWFKENTPADMRRRTEMYFWPPLHSDLISFERKLYDKGWGVPAWPKEYGGTGWDHVRQHIFEEERYNADAPDIHWTGPKLIGP